MLDRRSLPEPPASALAQSGDVYWVDTAGRTWRYVPLRVQLEQMLTVAEAQLHGEASLYGIALMVLAVAGGAALAVPGLAQWWGLAAWLGLTAAAALAEAVTAPGRLRAELAELEDRLAGGAQLPLLLDAELWQLLTRRLQRLLPAVYGEVHRPRTLAGQVAELAPFAEVLLDADCHVERVGLAAGLGGVIARRSRWAFFGGSPAAALTLVFSAPLLGLGVLWALLLAASGRMVQRSRVAEVAVLRALLAAEAAAAAPVEE